MQVNQKMKAKRCRLNKPQLGKSSNKKHTLEESHVTGNLVSRNHIRGNYISENLVSGNHISGTSMQKYLYCISQLKKVFYTYYGKDLKLPLVEKSRTTRQDWHYSYLASYPKNHIKPELLPQTQSYYCTTVCQKNRTMKVCIDLFMNRSTNPSTDECKPDWLKYFQKVGIFRRELSQIT